MVFLEYGFAGSSLAEEHFKANVQDGLSPVNSESEKSELTYSITVVGASGDLAKKKIFPAIFALFYEDCLPKVLILHSRIILVQGRFM